MICKCERITKKRTILDGIKSITGDLIVFVFDENESKQLYLRRCCFNLLVPSLYTLIHKEWIDDVSLVVVDPSTIQIQSKDIRGVKSMIYDVVGIKQSILDRIEQYGDDGFNTILVHSARFIGPEYTRVAHELNQAYHKVIAVEQIMNDLRYKYSAAVHDKTLLQSKSTMTIDQLDSTEQESDPVCERCNNLKALRTNQKEIKRMTHEQINKAQYDLEISRKANLELQAEIKKLREENLELKEINKALYMNR